MNKIILPLIVSFTIIIAGCKHSTNQSSDINTNTNDKSLRGWQIDSTNTGLAGVGVDKNFLPLCGLQPDQYSGNIVPPSGTIISERRIESPLDLSAGNITIDRCWIHPLSVGVGSPVISSNPSNLTNTIKDSEIDGTGITTDSVIGFSFAISGANTNVERCSIHDVGSGMVMSGDKPINIENNFIYHLRNGYKSGAGWGWSHTDGFTIRSFSGALANIANNRIIANTTYCTGAVFFQGTWAGHPFDNISVTGNLLEGTGNNLILEARNAGYGTHMRAVNNRFNFSEYNGYGVGYVDGGPGWAEWNENYINDPSKTDNKGALVPEPK